MLVTTCSNELQTDVNQNTDIYICLTGIMDSLRELDYNARHYAFVD